MGERNNTDELMVHIMWIRDGIDGINSRLDALNGRTRTNETDIAILKDRASDVRKTGGAWGASGGVLGGLLAGFIQHWLTGK